MTKPAQAANALKNLATALGGREQQLKREREAFKEERRALTAALDERQIELDKRDRLSMEKDSATEKTRKPAEVARMKVAVGQVGTEKARAPDHRRVADHPHAVRWACE